MPPTDVKSGALQLLPPSFEHETPTKFFLSVLRRRLRQAT
jgi:hypothetical protein